MPRIRAELERIGADFHVIETTSADHARDEGVVTHMRRAVEHGATKRELLEAVYAAAVPGGGPTLSSGVQAIMQLEREGAFA